MPRMAPDSNTTNGQAPKPPSIEYVGDTADEWDDRSVTKKYHRMKASEASVYVGDLKRDKLLNPKLKVQLDKLEEDERRIMEGRARLATSLTTEGLLGDLQDLFQEWWDEVKADGRDKRVGHSRDEREKFVKPTICDPPGNGVRKVGPKDDPAHEFNIYFMFFEKHGDQWKGKDYRGQNFPEYEHFPNQRISVHEALYNSTHNPFKPIPDENGKPYLRYIHIPANHMGVSKDVCTSISLMHK